MTKTDILDENPYCEVTLIHKIFKILNVIKFQ